MVASEGFRVVVVWRIELGAAKVFQPERVACTNTRLRHNGNGAIHCLNSHLGTFQCLDQSQGNFSLNILIDSLVKLMLLNINSQ